MSSSENDPTYRAEHRRISDRIEALQNLAFLMREKIGKPNELFLYLDQVAQILQDLSVEGLPMLKMVNQPKAF